MLADQRKRRLIFHACRLMVALLPQYVCLSDVGFRACGGVLRVSITAAGFQLVERVDVTGLRFLKCEHR